MNWFWTNIPLMVVFFAAWAAIPLWMVVRHRHWGPDPACPRGNPELEPMLVPVQAERVEPAGRQASPFPDFEERVHGGEVLVADSV